VQGVLDLGQQLFVGERFADVAGNPGLDRLHHVLFVAAAGHHHERHGFELRLLTAPGQQLQAGHLGHFPVAQHQIEGFAHQDGLGLFAVHRIFNLDPGEVIAQALLHQVANKRGVIHHQYTDFTHRPFIL